MESFKITGGNKMCGTVVLPSAKNAVLPLIACSVASCEEIVLKNCKRLSDADKMLKMIKNLGGKAEFVNADIVIDCSGLKESVISDKLASEIRSSIFLLGPMLSRFGYVEISRPGGCEIGLRPIDLHIDGLKRLNVKIFERNGLLICDGSKMRSADVYLDFPSVGATENLIMASLKLNGVTIIRNAAKEPEITDLANFINMIGGRVFGAGTDTVCVEGVKKLYGGIYEPIPDRIVAGTYMAACAVSGGEIRLENCGKNDMSALLDKFERAGCKTVFEKRDIVFSAPERLKCVGRTETQPFPGFPTDMQPQLVAMLCFSDGTSVVVENVFESRFKYTMQLQKAGADITVKDRIAVIRGKKSLFGCEMVAQDLRGGAAIVIAAIGAEGESTINDVRHIDRGYFKLEEDLNSLGVDIKRTVINK